MHIWCEIKTCICYKVDSTLTYKHLKNIKQCNLNISNASKDLQVITCWIM